MDNKASSFFRTHEKVVALLLDRGADLEAKDNYGKTALSILELIPRSIRNNTEKSWGRSYNCIDSGLQLYKL